MSFSESEFAKYTHFNVKKVADGVVHVETNRPKVYNAMSEE